MFVSFILFIITTATAFPLIIFYSPLSNIQEKGKERGKELKRNKSLAFDSNYAKSSSFSSPSSNHSHLSPLLPKHREIERNRDEDYKSNERKIFYDYPLEYKVIVNLGSRIKMMWVDGGFVKIVIEEGKRKYAHVTKNINTIYTTISDRLKGEQVKLYGKYKDKDLAVTGQGQLNRVVKEEFSKRFPIGGKLVVKLWCEISTDESSSDDL